jgi:hypothetical protein
MSLNTHRRLSPLWAAVAITLAIGSVSFASAARAGDAESDVTWELYKLRNSAPVAAQQTAPRPSPAAVPARFRHARHPVRR